ncbi:hypothetical protein [Rhodococcoides yunnanense]|uniref:hypothetical protein n=1 Tax=Rhodococcoides yunnanense TaxID=278209 RepID=UPI00093374EC|nr:hypothetical protein [Rhodococcus yunnanensis]
MNVDELVKATLRRRVACLVVVLCALAAGAYGAMSSTESYESSAVAVVYPPGAGDIDAKLNPFVNLNDNMSQLAAVTATMLQSSAAAALVEEAGASPEYTVTSTLGDTASALRLSPQLLITTNGPTPEAAQAGAQALLDYSSVALAELQVQTGVRPNTEASITAAVMPGPGSLVPTSPLRAAGSYGLAVLVVGLLGIVIFGTLLDRRRERTSVAPDAEQKAQTPAETPVESVEPTESAARPSVIEHKEPETAEPDTAEPEAAEQTHWTIPEFADFPAPEEPAPEEPEPEELAPEEPEAKEATTQRDRVLVRPPERIHSASAPKPPDSSKRESFDPFNVAPPKDPRPVEHAPRSAHGTAPAREIEQDIDDYYGVEERVHVPMRPQHHDYPRSAVTGGGPRR